MRVLVAGGITESLIRFRGPLLEKLRSLGHEVHACAGEPHAATRAALLRLGVVYHPVPLSRSGTNPFADLRYALALRELTRRIDPELVLSYTLKPAVFASLAGRAHRARTASMITGAGYALTEAKTAAERAVSAATRALLRAALASNEVVFFQNPDDLEEFVQRRLVTRSQCTLLAGSGVDVQHFTSSPPVLAPLTFLLVARLLRDKGILEFAESARLLRARSNLRFRLVGPTEPGRRGLTREELSRCVELGGLEYAGATDDVRPFLADSSVFVLPSYYREGQPRSILEALATGRAIVTCDVPGCRETVRDGVNGFLVPPRAPEHLAQTLARFVSAPELVTRMGAESRRLAEQRYDVRLVNDVIIGALGLSRDPRVLS